MLDIRGLPFEIPAYSLTGDILSFQRCGLQYRYYNGSSLPPSRPVQMWVGEFVHGVLEEAYRYWNEHRTSFPWPYTPTSWPPPLNTPPPDSNDIGALGHRVEVRLAATGKRSRSREARESAYQRVVAAVNQLGPHLFPIITTAEERISGTREMPNLPAGQNPRGERYELTGVVDVISSVVLGSVRENPIVDLIEKTLPTPLEGEYDLIVDYKAMRRPPLGSEPRNHYEWQVQTYAWLRNHTPHTRRVGAAILIYVNELHPSEGDLTDLKEEISQGKADVSPTPGSQDYYALFGWHSGPGVALPALSQEFRFERAVQVVNVGNEQLWRAVTEIDSVVAHIESAAFVEHNTGNIPRHWPATGQEQDCAACDFAHFCPSPYQSRQSGQVPQPPRAPG